MLKQSSTSPDFSVVVPVYHGEKTLTPLTERLLNFFNTTAYTFEIIFVYDCGPDNSWSVIKELVSLYPHLIRAVHLSRNFGQHNALICGFSQARGRFCITMDEDLQHDPFDIATLINAQQGTDADVVYGAFPELRHSGFRNWTSRVLKKLIAVGVPDMPNYYSAFRLIKSPVAKELLQMSNSYTFLDGYLSWVTKSYAKAEVTHAERFAGKSSYNLKKLVEHSINIFITFSNLPIRIVTLSSLFIFFLSAGYSFYIFLRKLIYGDLLTGFATLVIMIGFGVGFILLALGVVGEYIYRINLKTTRRPNFVTREVLE